MNGELAKIPTVQMKSELDLLKDKHDREIIELQARCKHKKSTWAMEWWAPGHTTGGSVKVCNNCGKVLEKK